MDARKKEELQAIQHGREYLVYKTALEEPLVWIFIDEGHEFLPKDAITPATDALKQLLREGRQPGISLAIATQQPGKIHTDVMTQSDVVLSHRVTALADIKALNEIAATYLPKTIQLYIDELPPEKGTAILLDDKLEKIYPMKVRPKLSWHGGGDPSAIRSELKEYSLSP